MRLRKAWQIAIARASETSSGFGGFSRLSSLVTINSTCFLSAAPFPTTASFTSGGVYSDHSSPFSLPASKITPKAFATSSAVVLLAAKICLSVAIAAGWCLSIRAKTSR